MKKIKDFLGYLFVVLLLACAPKGPVTFESPWVGKSLNNLISQKGEPSEIKLIEGKKVVIYRRIEEVYGKNYKEGDQPKCKYVIENIFYVNEKENIYKYQVWKKKQKPEK